MTVLIIIIHTHYTHTIHITHTHITHTHYTHITHTLHTHNTHVCTCTITIPCTLVHMYHYQRLLLVQIFQLDPTWIDDNNNTDTGHTTHILKVYYTIHIQYTHNSDIIIIITISIVESVRLLTVIRKYHHYSTITTDLIKNSETRMVINNNYYYNYSVIHENGTECVISLWIHSCGLLLLLLLIIVHYITITHTVL